MTFQGNEMLRYVYSFTFPDGSIYFGLTNDYNRRILDHKKDATSKVFKHIKLTNEEPEFKLITPYLVPTETAQQIKKKFNKRVPNKGN